MYHAGKQTEVVLIITMPWLFLEELLILSKIPRDYVSSLESQIAKLTKENEELRARTPRSIHQDDTNSTSPANSEYWMTSTLGRVINEPTNQPRFFGVSSGIALARLVMAAIHVESLPSSLPGGQAQLSTQQHTSGSSTPVCQASLPPRQAAEHLVDVYFQYQTPHFPIIERSQVDKAIEGAYTGSDQDMVSQDAFTAYMIFAIALYNVHHPSGGRPPQSEDCFHSAISEIDKVFVYSRSRIETLRAILLLCQYIALCPSKGSLWLLTGTALRLAVDLGLHWETEEHRLHLDPVLLDQRRRLWYSTYLFDRLLCITLGRPFGIPDGNNVDLPAIYVENSRQTPNEFDIHARRGHNHLIIMAQYESEIKQVLYNNSRNPTIAWPKPDYPLWMRDIQCRLQDWYASIPPPSNAHPSSIFASQAYWDAIYNNTLLFLHRPNPVISQPSSETLRISFEAALKVISSIKMLHRARKIDVMWKWVHHLFMAGLTVLYGLWQHSDLQLTETKESISVLQSCSSTLSALSERWAGAAGCRDAFETLSSATVDWLITANVEEMRQSRVQFEKQLQSLQEQLPPLFPGEAVGGDPLSILSTDSFRFGESLSLAAEWPDFQHVDFTNMDF